eukprot:1195398-Prorocentrum_minimum.AAC.6
MVARVREIGAAFRQLADRLIQVRAPRRELCGILLGVLRPEEPLLEVGAELVLLGELAVEPIREGSHLFEANLLLMQLLVGPGELVTEEGSVRLGGVARSFNLFCEPLVAGLHFLLQMGEHHAEISAALWVPRAYANDSDIHCKRRFNMT